MSRLAIPALESVRYHPLFDPPERDPGDDQIPPETDEEFEKRKKGYELVASIEIGIVYAGRDTVLELSGLSRKIGHEEKRRLKKLKKEFAKEDYPQLYQAGYQTEEGSGETLKWQRKVLKGLMRGLRGLDVIVDEKKIDIAEIDDVDRLIGILEVAGWSFGAALLALRKQTPTEKELLPSEL